MILAVVVYVGRNRSDGPLSTTYRIGKEPVLLINGRAEVQAAPGSATKIITEVVNEPVFGDLNSDNRNDAALFIIQDTGGSGTFYYLTAAIRQDRHWRGTNAAYIGDRIMPVSLKINHGVIAASFMDRSPGQPMATPPTVTRLLQFKLVDDQLEPLVP